MHIWLPILAFLCYFCFIYPHFHIAMTIKGISIVTCTGANYLCLRYGLPTSKLINTRCKAKGPIGAGLQIQGHMKDIQCLQLGFYCNFEADRIHGADEVHPKPIKCVAGDPPHVIIDLPDQLLAHQAYLTVSRVN